MRNLFLSILLLTSYLAADSIVTDRPDFTESNELAKTTQIETGYTFNHHEESEHAFGEVLVRTPLNKHTELRIGLPTYIKSDSVSGLSDSNLGVKLKFHDMSAWIVGTSLPTGAKDLKDEALNPFVKWCGAKDLSDRFSFASNLGVQWSGAASKQKENALMSLSLNAEITSKMSSYYEYYTFESSYINAGVTYLFTENFQGDLRLGTSVSSNEYFMGLGMAYRL